MDERKTFGLLDNMSWREQVRRAMRMAREQREAVGDSRTIQATLGWGARGDFELFEPFLQLVNVVYLHVPLNQSDDPDEYGEYRKILTPEHIFREAVNDFDADTVVLFEDGANRTLANYLGGLRYVVENGDGRIRRVFLSGPKDAVGALHFAMLRTRGYKGAERFMEKRTPNLYDEMGDEGRSMIADYDPHETDGYTVEHLRPYRFLGPNYTSKLTNAAKGLQIGWSRDHMRRRVENVLHRVAML